ncbi:MAG: penicillin-binding transpeptidase domain-containing protein, partial [Pseudomonadota bacterium]
MGNSEKLDYHMTRRGLVLGGIVAAVAVGIASRFYNLQIIDSRKYETLSRKNYLRGEFSAPQRGQIYDRNGIIVAQNDSRHDALLDLSKIRPQDLQLMIERLRDIIPLSQRQIAALFDALSRKSRETLVLASNLGTIDVHEFLVRKPYIPGLEIHKIANRKYHFGASMAHILGYVGEISDAHKDRIARNDPVRRLPNFLVGRRGIEFVLDQHLRGTPGLAYQEYSARGIKLGNKAAVPRITSRAGRDVRLTIDAKLQAYAAQRMMQARVGALVIMDIKDGSILASVSTPSFEPLWFRGGINANHWQKLQDDQQHPLINRPVMGLFAPGSTIKP